MATVRPLCVFFALLFLPFLAQGLQYIVIGDWGDDNPDQYAVADAMSNWCTPSVRGPCDFILGTGDNFYPDGVMSADSERFNTTWKWVYDLPHIKDLVWYQTLGNHDYAIDDRELYQVDYAVTESLWYLPWIYYDFTVYGEDGAVVHFIGFDSEALMLRKHDSETQLAWLEDTLARSTADWKVLFVHHPPYSTGGHPPGNPTMREFIVPLLNKYNVELYFAGHEHNLEHITSQNITDYVISGGGGRGLYEYSPVGEEILNGWGVNVDYFGYHFGFVWMTMTKTSYTAEFVDETMTVRYSYTRTK